MTEAQTKPSKSKDKPAEYASFEDMPAAVFDQNVEKTKQLIDQFLADVNRLLPGLVTLTAEQRSRAPRLRDGEHGHLLTVLDVVDKKPHLFESLADTDEGMDPKKFETALLRDRIEKHRRLSELAKLLAPLSDEVNDTPLYLASRFRDALSAAYRIAKAHAETDRTIMDKLAPVIDFMRKASVAAAAKRKNK